MERLDSPLEPVYPVMAAGATPDLPARAAAAHHRRSVAVQPPAPGNPHGVPVTYADGVLPPLATAGDQLYGAEDMMRATDIGTDQTLPYYGELGIGPGDENTPPRVRA